MTGINKTVAAENPAGPLDGSELCRVVQTGQSARTTLQAIADLRKLPLNAKGQILVYGNSGAEGLNPGTDTYVLTLDSTQESGFRYNPPGVSASTLSAANGSSGVGFQQAGPGTVARNSESKMQEFYSVNDVGGAPGTVATAQIQAALNDSGYTDGYGTWGQQVNVLSGYWGTASTISIPRRKDIYGQGIESTRIVAGFSGGNIGTPMFSMTSHPDWRLQSIRFEGGSTAAGLFFNGQNYYGVGDQIHVNNTKTYGIWLNESAQSIFRSLSMYSSSASTDVAIVLDGGSQNTLLMGQLDTGSIGIQSSTAAAGTYHSLSGNGSGFRSIGTAYGAQYPAHKIGTGDALWDLVGGYYENTSNPGTPTDIFDIGSFAGAGGSNATMVNFARNQVSGSGVNDIVVNNARQFNFWGNELGVNTTVEASTVFFTAWGNNISSGKTITDQAQYSDIRQRNDYRHSSPDGTRADTISSSFGVFCQALNRALTNYILKTIDALNFDWRLSGSTTNKMSLGANGTLSLSSALFPGLLGATPAQQSVCGFRACTGVPSNSFGGNGDYAFRSDASGAGTHIYFKSAGAWTGIV